MELTESRKLIIIDLISEFKKNDTYSLWKTDYNNFLKDKEDAHIITEILKYKLELITSPTKDTYRLTKKGIIFSSFENLDSGNTKVILNNFNNSTIGQLNQSNDSSVLKTEIKQTIYPKEKQQNAIISFIVKFWWQILVPLAIVIIGILIERDVINIRF
jgi:hypothetical protein